METETFAYEWTFTRQIDVPEFAHSLMSQGEVAFSAYQTIRDSAIVTNKRLIIVDFQGITGHKKEIYHLPFKSVYAWSTENAGMLDLTAEVQLWTRIGTIKVNFQRGVDVRAFDALLAQTCL